VGFVAIPWSASGLLLAISATHRFAHARSLNAGRCDDSRLRRAGGVLRRSSSAWAPQVRPVPALHRGAGSGQRSTCRAPIPGSCWCVCVPGTSLALSMWLCWVWCSASAPPQPCFGRYCTARVHADRLNHPGVPLHRRWVRRRHPAGRSQLFRRRRRRSGRDLRHFANS